MRGRPTVVLAVITAVVVVMAAVALVASALRETPAFDRSTPEGTAQAYAAAVLSGDDATALELLDPRLGCTSDVLVARTGPSRGSFSLVSTRPDNRGARVVLEITERQSGPFAEPWIHRETFLLVRGPAGWLVAGEPWPVYVCKG